MKPRLLVIRGGAIGDFILTLPAIRLLREAFPGAHLEILGYRHIIALAEGRFYADAIRSIEYSAMAGFFVPRSDLAPDLVEYFASFQQVVSYLFDPDRFFETNVRRAGVKNFLPAYAKIDDSAHAAQQLARPLQSLALYLDDHAATVHPSGSDRAYAAEFLGNARGRPIAIHPGVSRKEILCTAARISGSHTTEFWIWMYQAANHPIVPLHANTRPPSTLAVALSEMARRNTYMKMPASIACSAATWSIARNTGESVGVGDDPGDSESCVVAGAAVGSRDFVGVAASAEATKRNGKLPG